MVVPASTRSCGSGGSALGGSVGDVRRVVGV